MIMNEKLALIKTIFTSTVSEEAESTPLQDGKYYGGVYNGRKYLYSDKMISTLSIEKLESFIKKQISYV